MDSQTFPIAPGDGKGQHLYQKAPETEPITGHLNTITRQLDLFCRNLEQKARPLDLSTPTLGSTAGSFKFWARRLGLRDGTPDPGSETPEWSVRSAQFRGGKPQEFRRAVRPKERIGHHV